jgi:DNA-binding PucR family transcriptional regulator
MEHSLADRPLEAASAALAATVMGNKSLMTHLFERYLSPLENTSMGGRTARKALRALFDAEHNVSSAAYVLNVHRSTVHRWRKEIEETLDCRLCEHRVNIEIALGVEEVRRNLTLVDAE